MCTCARFRQSSIQSHRCSASGYLQFYPTELYPLFSLVHKPSWCKLNQLWFGSDSGIHLIYISVFSKTRRFWESWGGLLFRECEEQLRTKWFKMWLCSDFVLQHWTALAGLSCLLLFHSSGWLMHWGTCTAGKETVNQRREQRVAGHTGCSN